MVTGSYMRTNSNASDHSRLSRVALPPLSRVTAPKTVGPTYPEYPIPGPLQKRQHTAVLE